MNIVKIRFSESVVAFNADVAPVLHRFEAPEIGAIIEVRSDKNEERAYVYGKRDQDGVVTYAGKKTGFWSLREEEVNTYIVRELFSVGRRLKVPKPYVWGFVEQLPVFTNTGVNVRKALALVKPVHDLLAAGAQHPEILSSLSIDADMLEFILGEPVQLRHSPYW